MAEQWRNVVGYEGLYEVSDYGNVRSTYRGRNTGRVLAAHMRTRKGRKTGRHVALSKEGNITYFPVSRLVAAAFLGPANGRLVLHWDDDKENDYLSNLRYGTHQENMTDKVRNGGSLKGSKHHKAKLTEDKVRLIKPRLAAGECHRALAKEFDVSVETMQSIKHGRNWGWLIVN